MAAPKGNQFWKLRLKHGRDRIIQDPVMLWENACEYFEWCIENPLIEIDFRGKDIQEVALPKMRVFQKDAFALACGLSQWRTIEDLKNVSDDFLQVVTRIEKTIYSQKFEGSAAGFFNPSIIARDLGLSDNSTVTIETDKKRVVDLFPPAEDFTAATE